MADKYIPGIYNYCDRWCERCPLTARCRVFALEEERKRGDDFYAAYWRTFDELAGSESEAWSHEDIVDDPDQHNELSLPELEEWEDKLDAAVEGDPMVRLAKEYAEGADQWLDEHLPDEEAVESQTSAPPVEKIGREEAMDILYWYLHQIGIKLWRAMHAVHESEDELDISDDQDQAEDEDDISTALLKARQQDRDGSAKVALIGIERSLGAWTIVRNEFPGQDQAIRDFQRMLGRLRRLIDERIPGARVFQRPGFEYDV